MRPEFPAGSDVILYSGHSGAAANATLWRLLSKRLTRVRPNRGRDIAGNSSGFMTSTPMTLAQAIERSLLMIAE
jgi:hypothetical protein